MKENLTLKGQLRGYLAWPLLLALFPIAGNVAMAILSPSAAAVLAQTGSGRAGGIFLPVCLDSEAASGGDGDSLCPG